MTSEAILTELRSLPGAPDRLRERVRALPEPKPRIAWTPPHVDVRRTLLVLAPAVVVLGVSAAALHGVLAGGGTTQRPEPVARGVGGGTVMQQVAKSRYLAPCHGVTKSTAPDRVATTQQPFGIHIAPQPLPPSTTRLNRY